MTWTFVLQLMALAAVATFLLICIAAIFREPGRIVRGQPGPPGPRGAPAHLDHRARSAAANPPTTRCCWLARRKETARGETHRSHGDHRRPDDPVHLRRLTRADQHQLRPGALRRAAGAGEPCRDREPRPRVAGSLRLVLRPRHRPLGVVVMALEFAHHPHTPEYDEQGNAVSAVDWQGNRFHVGQLVYYAIGAGRGQLIAVGEVVKIRTKDVENWNGETQQYVEVSVHTRKTSGSWDNKERTKPTWVNAQNITAPVDPNQAGTA